jgi:hypothetical protein
LYPFVSLLFQATFFLAADSSFGVFVEMVKSDCPKDCVPISLNDEAAPVNNDVPFLSLADTILPRKKAKALLLILLVSWLHVNSSLSIVHQHKSILQPIFTAAYFSTVPSYFHFPFNLEEINAAT